MTEFMWWQYRRVLEERRYLDSIMKAWGMERKRVPKPWENL